MKTDWDYTGMSKVYLARPNYSPVALNKIYEITGLRAGDKVCDIGAGVAHLSLPLEAYGCVVDAVEPNDDMRNTGTKRTIGKNITWFEGIAENTGRQDNFYDLVTFGSSFGVCDRSKALLETDRILKSGKWFACLWNHRDFTDPVQKHIEDIIAENISDYDYGTRREDQLPVIEESGFFKNIQKIEGQINWKLSLPDIMEAWHSHATLKRQAGASFHNIIEQIQNYLESLNMREINVPYTTRGWLAQKIR